jgi:hypothetical protein
VSSLVVWVVLALALVGALYALLLIARNRPVDDPLFYIAAVLEAVLVGQTVAGCIAMVVTGRDIAAVTFLGYLLTSLITPPVAVLWGISDKSRWGTAVVVVAMVTVAALELRLVALWGGAGA